MRHCDRGLYEKFRKKENFGQPPTVWPKDIVDKHNVARSSRMLTLAQTEFRHIAKVKADLKAMLPSLTPAEIRRFYVAHHEAVIQELEELGWKYASEFLKSLLEFDEEIRREAGPTTVVWNKPRLRDQNDFIDRLRDGLVDAEKAKIAGQSAVQTVELLNIAIFFQKKTWEWWWIAERLYQSALLVAESVMNDDQTITLVRYLYGRFLFNEMHDSHNAVYHLNQVRQASDGKPWNASRILSEKQESIFRECNILLHKCLLALAKEICQLEPKLAAETYEEALSRAVDSGHNEYVAEVLYELGRNQLRAGNVKSAVQHFAKLLAMARRLPDPEGVCNAHMELAFAYKELEDNDSAEKHLGMFREAASKFGLSYKLAQAYYYTGEHFLGLANPQVATSSLEKAFHLYSEEEGLNEEVDRARCIAGVSKGQETMKQYINLLLQCGDGNKDATLKICQWKSRRDISWIEKRSEANTSNKNVDDSEAVPYESSTVTSSSLIPTGTN